MSEVGKPLQTHSADAQVAGPLLGPAGNQPRGSLICTVHLEDHFWQADQSSPGWETWGQGDPNSELEACLLRLAKSRHIPAPGGVELDRKQQPLQPGPCHPPLLGTTEFPATGSMWWRSQCLASAPGQRTCVLIQSGFLRPNELGESYTCSGCFPQPSVPSCKACVGLLLL